MFNVSFSSHYGKVALNPNEKIGNMTAGKLAQATNDAFELASQDIGRTVKPIRRISGESLKRINPESFDASGRLTQTGKEGFVAVNGRMLGLGLDSKTHEYVKALREQIAKTAYFEDDGKTASVATCFDYYTK